MPFSQRTVYNASIDHDNNRYDVNLKYPSKNKIYLKSDEKRSITHHPSHARKVNFSSLDPVGTTVDRIEIKRDSFTDIKPSQKNSVRNKNMSSIGKVVLHNPLNHSLNTPITSHPHRMSPVPGKLQDNLSFMDDRASFYQNR
jgi:hypothetical protein